MDAEDAPVAAEEDAWVKELLDALLARETPMAATAALVTALKVRSRFVFRRSIAPFFLFPVANTRCFYDERFYCVRILIPLMRHTNLLLSF